MERIKRSITDTIITRLNHEQVVALTGARQTGKTTLCEMLLPERLDLSFTYISFDDPDERLRFQHSAVQILENITTPLVVLDEVQKIPQLFDPLKLVVDRERKKPVNERKRFVLTGSSQLLMMKNIRETLAGLEVDFLLASEHGILPIEAKSSERVTSADGRSVETFIAEHPEAAKVGLVVYPGNEVVELRRNIWGVPDWYLLGAL